MKATKVGFMGVVKKEKEKKLNGYLIELERGISVERQRIQRTINTVNSGNYKNRELYLDNCKNLSELLEISYISSKTAIQNMLNSPIPIQYYDVDETKEFQTREARQAVVNDLYYKYRDEVIDPEVNMQFNNIKAVKDLNKLNNPKTPEVLKIQLRSGLNSILSDPSILDSIKDFARRMCIMLETQVDEGIHKGIINANAGSVRVYIDKDKQGRVELLEILNKDIEEIEKSNNEGITPYMLTQYKESVIALKNGLINGDFDPIGSKTIRDGWLEDINRSRNSVC